MAKAKHIVVIGGGAIGVCTAYFLWKTGHQVTILEKHDIGQACSYGNSGLIVPSHFVPLACPELRNKVFEWLFNARSPFYIPLRMELPLLHWLWHFYFSSNQRHVNRSIVLLRDLNLLSKALFHEIFEEQLIHFPLDEKGVLVLFNSDQYGEWEYRLARLASNYNIDVDFLTSDQVNGMNPGMHIHALGGIHYRQDAHTDPFIFVRNMAHFLERQGVEILRYTHAMVFEENPHDRMIKGVVTSEGEFFADEYVLCCGSQSHELLNALDIHMPLQAAKGYSITLGKANYQPAIPLLLSELKVAVTPLGQWLRFAGSMEFTGNDISINLNRIEYMFNQVHAFLPDFHFIVQQMKDAWAGLRPCSPDGLPYIGRFHNFKNLIAATGHAKMGFSLGPITGKLVSEIVSGKPLSVDISRLSPDRFG